MFKKLTIFVIMLLLLYGTGEAVIAGYSSTPAVAVCPADGITSGWYAAEVNHDNNYSTSTNGHNSYLGQNSLTTSTTVNFCKIGIWFDADPGGQNVEVSIYLPVGGAPTYLSSSLAGANCTKTQAVTGVGWAYFLFPGDCILPPALYDFVVRSDVSSDVTVGINVGSTSIGHGSYATKWNISGTPMDQYSSPVYDTTMKIFNK